MNEILNNNELIDVRHDWTAAQIEKILNLPLNDLIYRAQTIHRHAHPEGEVQLSSLLSIKTGRLQGRLQILFAVRLSRQKDRFEI